MTFDSESSDKCVDPAHITKKKLIGAGWAALEPGSLGLNRFARHATPEGLTYALPKGLATYRTGSLLIFDNLTYLDTFDPWLFAKPLDQMATDLLRCPLKDGENVVVYDAYNA